MKDASSYPITFKYGATTSPYSASHPHSGEDRAMPIGTPVIVGGVTIGLSGTTGQSTGPHLHIQKRVNNVIVAPQGGGFNVTGVVAETGQNSEIGKFVRIQAGVDKWSYFHLNEVKVKVSDKIGGIVEPADYKMNKGDVINGFKIFGRVPSQADLDAWTGQTFKKFQYEKIVEGVALMPPKGFKPAPTLFVEDK